MKCHVLTVVTFLSLVVCNDVRANEPDSPSDWPVWRGPDQTGIASPNQQPLLKWSETEGVRWKVAVPGRGHGSPTVFGKQIFLTTADEEKAVQSVICFDRESGKTVWTTEVHKGPLNFKNKKASQASCSVACDGERLFVNFLNDGAAYTTALSLDGKILWQKKVTDYVVHQGYGSSPCLYKTLVIVSADNKQGGAVVAYDRKTGDEVWRVSRPETPNYPSPVVFRCSGKDQVLLSGCNLVTGLDPMTGKKLWETEGATTECVTTAVTNGTVTITSGGYPKNHVSAVKTDGSGELAWEDPTRVYVPSMIIEDGLLFGVADAGIAICWECSTGKVLWKKRLRGTFSSSLVKWKDHLFATNENGITFVLKVSAEECEIVAENTLGDEAFATPVICNSQIFMRHATSIDDQRQEFLYCIEQ